MNLKQAYDEWGKQQQNRQLYLATRYVFVRAWVQLDMRKPCAEYDKHTLSLALADTKVVISEKAKAASVMVEVLKFAHFAEPKDNSLPAFEYNELLEYSKYSAGMLELVRNNPPQPMTLSQPITDVPLVKVKPEALEKRQQELRERGENDTDKLVEDINKHVDNIEKSMRRGDIYQLDPQTYKVIRVFKSSTEAHNVTWACNVSRAAQKHTMAGGYYWAYKEDVDNFKPNDKSKENKKKVVVKLEPTAEPKQEPVNREKYPLANISDSELIEELRRRGWKGQITISVNVDL